MAKVLEFQFQLGINFRNVHIESLEEFNWDQEENGEDLFPGAKVREGMAQCSAHPHEINMICVLVSILQKNRTSRMCVYKYGYRYKYIKYIWRDLL